MGAACTSVAWMCKTSNTSLNTPTNSATLENVPSAASSWTFAGLTRPACVADVYDGDTVHIVTRRSKEEPYAKYTLRLLGVDAPELRPGLSLRDRALHIDAAQHARRCLAQVVLHKQVEVEFMPEEKFGRLLGTVYVHTASGRRNVNEWLVAAGLAKRYNGSGARAQWSATDLARVLAVPCTSGPAARAQW